MQEATIIPPSYSSGIDGEPLSSQTTCVAATPSSAQIESDKMSSSVIGLVPITPEPIGLRLPLPKLPYSLRTRKRAIAIAWIFILLDSCFLPLSLFYILKYGAGLNDARSLGISNSIFGFFSFFQFGFRMYRLLRSSPHYRPLGATSRFSLDLYQIQFFIGFVVITILISFGTSISPPSLRVLAMSPTALLIQCGPQFLFSCYAYKKRWKAPFRMSSVEKGEYAPPALFTIIEDIVAVDGGGGREYRAAIKARYEASEKFREMIWQLTLIWGIGATLTAAATSAVVWTVPKHVAYGFGWSFPFLWAAVMAVWTTRWVQKKLKEESEWWDDGVTSG